MLVQVHQFNKRRRAMGQLKSIFANDAKVYVIHYSCEALDGGNTGKSPRITSIATRNLSTGSSRSFSLFHVAEERHVPLLDVPDRADDLERVMLKDFYSFLQAHNDVFWLHWNMRDSSFGFPALAHRARVLGVVPVDLADDRLHDLSRLLVSMFGVGYINHPRLESLVDLNKITKLNFLSGADEAKAFAEANYTRLQQSTLRKVDTLANIAERAVTGTLRTRSRFHERYGVGAREAWELVSRHWLVSGALVLVGILGSLASIFGLSVRDCRSYFAEANTTVPRQRALPSPSSSSQPSAP